MAITVRNEGGTLAYYDEDGTPLTAAQARALVAATPEGAAAVNGKTLRDRATTALTGNATYLALASPTTAQNTAQIRALTRQMDALIRLTVGALDTTTGT
jgi:hypothetical protein